MLLLPASQFNFCSTTICLNPHHTVHTPSAAPCFPWLYHHCTCASALLPASWPHTCLTSCAYLPFSFLCPRMLLFYYTAHTTLPARLHPILPFNPFCTFCSNSSNARAAACAVFTLAQAKRHLPTALPPFARHFLHTFPHTRAHALAAFPIPLPLFPCIHTYCGMHFPLPPFKDHHFHALCIFSFYALLVQDETGEGRKNIEHLYEQKQSIHGVNISSLQFSSMNYYSLSPENILYMLLHYLYHYSSHLSLCLSTSTI